MTYLYDTQNATNSFSVGNRPVLDVRVSVPLPHRKTALPMPDRGCVKQFKNMIWCLRVEMVGVCRWNEVFLVIQEMTAAAC